MIILLGLVLTVGFLLWARARPWDASPFPMMGTVIAGASTLLMVAAAVVNYLGFAPEMARLAATRKAVAQLPCSATFSGSQVYGDAVRWNQEIASQQIWNHRWVGDPFIPDGWDTVSVIVLPDCR